jgi:hypothetical protein
VPSKSRVAWGGDLERAQRPGGLGEKLAPEVDGVASGGDCELVNR